MGNPGFWRKLENVGVILIALHSFLIGMMLIFTTTWVLDFAGWDEVSHPFFPRQSGAFHIILAVGYFWEYRSHGTIRLLLLAKASLLHPVFYALTGLLGAGLLVAGITGRCGLTALLARMPWNRSYPGQTTASA